MKIIYILIVIFFNRVKYDEEFKNSLNHFKNN